MAFPWLVGTSATATSNTSITPTINAGAAADDIAWLVIVHNAVGTVAPTLGTISVSAGWTLLEETAENVGSRRSKAAIYWRRLTGGDANPTVTLSGAAGNAGIRILAQIASVTGCKTSGNPYNVAGAGFVEDTGTTDVTATSITPGVNGCEIALFVCNDSGRTVSAQSTTSPGALTEIVDTTAGTGTGLAVASANQATAGATGTGTATLSSTAGNHSWLIALEPPASGTSETPAPGGAIAAGTTPAPQATAAAGGGTGAGTSPSPSPTIPVATGGAIAQGTELSGASAAVTPGGAVAAGTGSTASTTVSAGGATAAGTGPTATASVAAGGALVAGVEPTVVVPVTPGGALAGGTPPTDGSAVTETPTPGGALAGGTGLTASVAVASGGAIAGGVAPTESITAETVAGGGAPPRRKRGRGETPEIPAERDLFPFEPRRPRPRPAPQPERLAPVARPSREEMIERIVRATAIPDAPPTSLDLPETPLVGALARQGEALARAAEERALRRAAERELIRRENEELLLLMTI